VEHINAQQFLETLALVLGAAALSTLLFQKLKQPVVLGYLIAGMVVGPYTPIPLLADSETVHTLSQLGVILLMFSLGLEFSIRKLFKVFPSAGFIAILQSSLMIWLGYIAGQLLGWTKLESVYAGAILAISSTTIIIKAFVEQGVQGKLTDIVFGILIVEDLIAILLLAILVPFSSQGDLTGTEIVKTIGALFLFLLILIFLGLLIVPRLFRFITRFERPEITLVASIGFCFTIALVAELLGYSVALGAFLAGSLIAESGEEKQIEKLICPVRDLFGAIFFVSVGMLINPAVIPKYWSVILLFTFLVVIGKIGGVALGAFLTGYSPRLSIKSGMSMAQIGEFSFIIAGVGLANEATREFLYPIAVTVSAITTLLTPWLIRISGPVANFVDNHLPSSLQTFTSLYGSWIQKIKQNRVNKHSAIRRLFVVLALDCTLIVGLIISFSIFRPKFTSFLADWVTVPTPLLNLLVLALAGICIFPFLFGMIQSARKLGFVLASGVIPVTEKGKLDLGAAPRRALVVSLQLVIILIIGSTLLAILQPFIPLLYSGTFGIILIFLGIAFWRGAENLQGHVKSGAEVVLEALSPQEHTPESRPLSLSQLLPGIGEIIPISLGAESPVLGKTLAELDLRGLTGVSVIAIIREGQKGLVVPTGKERLQANDQLALVGTPEDIETSKKMLLRTEENKD